MFAVLLSLLACGTQAGTSGQNPYKIRHYALRIVPDFTTKAISVSAVIEIDNPGLQDSFDFGLNGNYDSVRVGSPSSPVKMERSGGAITIKTSQPSEKMLLSFELKGTLGRSNDENRAIMDDSSLFLLWSDRFYPIDFDQWAPVRMEVVLPTGFQAIAPGRLTETDASGPTVRYVFECATPTVQFSLFADRRWIKTERTMNGLPMQTLLYPQSQKFSDQIFTTSSEVLSYFSSIMCPYPFERFSFVTIDSMYARRAFPGFVGYQPRYLEKEFTTTGHDAHETSLLWWGYTTHGTGPGSFQWTEGFGDYAEVLYDEVYHKPIPRIFERFRSEYLSLPGEQDVPYTDLRGDTPQKIVHGKYPWLMHLVRFAVGDSAFVKGWKLLFERFRHSTFSMDQFIATLEEGCGQSLRWWREDWLERKGVPDMSFTSRIEKSTAGFRVTCILEQHGDVYHMPLEIGIESGSGLRLEKVRLKKRSEKFTFDTEEEPRQILLDPNRWILMKVTPGGTRP